MVHLKKLRKEKVAKKGLEVHRHHRLLHHRVEIWAVVCLEQDTGLLEDLHCHEVHFHHLQEDRLGDCVPVAFQKLCSQMRRC